VCVCVRVFACVFARVFACACACACACAGAGGCACVGVGAGSGAGACVSEGMIDLMSMEVGSTFYRKVCVRVCQDHTRCTHLHLNA